MLRLSFMGRPQIMLASEPITSFSYKKSVALLCYLAMTQRPHTRESLAALFWGDFPTANGRTHLRKSLSGLRRLVGNHLIITNKSVEFDASKPYWLDTEIFLERAQVLQLALRNKTAIDETLAESLVGAIDLYQDELLAGFYVRDAPDFDDWYVRQRDHLQREAQRIVEVLTTYYAQQNNRVRALAYARRWLTFDPLQEKAHRAVMRLLAQDGQRAAALQQYEACRQTLWDELGVEPSQATLDLYELLVADKVLPLTANGAAAQQFRCEPKIPAPTTPFFGRSHELADITANLANQDCRLVTVTGIGGVGKTRLAHEVAFKLLDDWRDGICFVSLDAITLEQPLWQVLADALDLELATRDDLIAWLATKELLLILDNFDHLANQSNLLLTVLHKAPSVKWLITARGRLKLPSEWVIHLDGLPILTRSAKSSGQDNCAVQLFIQRARQARPRFRATNKNLPHIVRITQHLQGHPLSIELAAIWVHMLSCAEIAAELTHSLQMLQTTQEMLTERHTSLYACFDYSYALLSEPTQQVWQMLSIFDDAFDRNSAETVTDITLSQLAQLVDKSLLQRAATDRYRLHPLHQHYLRAKLAENAAVEADVRERHARYFASLLDTQTMGNDAGAGVAIQTVEIEMRSILAAWQWAVASNEQEIINRMALPLQRYRQLTGRDLVTSGDNRMTLEQLSAEATDNQSESAVTDSLKLIKVSQK